MFTAEEILKWLLGLLASGVGMVLVGLATRLIKQFGVLTEALQSNTEEIKGLSATVRRLDRENRSLRNSHDAITKHLIAKGILPAPDPYPAAEYDPA
ncbi:hypothetical protein [Hymenobacter fodinae]|uniref:Uncharacterized protein n=1 Tax=Hymenobacter fodinae TaxID=2510796 RepID=A0A4Z0P8G7_9BACT|nr:hypothetical protein [Hymenobacter fodinae]TGE08248.1 hypothetical protein EU556_11030 [Hymenobacter fodinae]